MKKFKNSEIKKHSKKTETLFVKIFLMPLANKIALFFINDTNFKPYHISFLGLFFGVISAFLFYSGNHYFAAASFIFAMILDQVDGLVARVKNLKSVFGIIIDNYSDVIIIIINSFSLIIINFDNKLFVILMLTFLILNYIESWFDFTIYSVFKYFSDKKKIEINTLDILFDNLKKKLEKFKLRTIFFYYQERYFCIFVLSPIFSFNNYFLLSILVLVFFMINFKIIFDISMIKISLSKKVNHSFKFRKNINE